jgi:hypothetical protein
MEPALCRQAKPGNISCIGWNLWFNQHDVEHTTPKTKKAPQSPRRFFRREGSFIAVLASRTQLRRFDRFDIHPATALVKPYDTIYKGKNCVIATQSDIFARQKFRAALSDNDIPSHYLLAPKFLDAQTFADAVPSVLNTPLTFLVRHTSESPIQSLIGQSLQS